MACRNVPTRCSLGLAALLLLTPAGELGAQTEERTAAATAGDCLSTDAASTEIATLEVEIAELRGRPLRSLERQWRFARALLLHHMKDAGD